MKFGKEFTVHLEETLPEWRDKYLCYKPLKKLLKHIPTTADSSPSDDAAVVHLPLPPVPDHLEEWFVRILSEELEKFNDFYVDKEEEFVIRFQICEYCSQCEYCKTRAKEEDFSITQFCSWFESKYEGIMHPKMPPEVYVSRKHEHMQYNEPKQAVKREAADNMIIYSFKSIGEERKCILVKWKYVIHILVTPLALKNISCMYNQNNSCCKC